MKRLSQKDYFFIICQAKMPNPIERIGFGRANILKKNRSVKE